MTLRVWAQIDPTSEEGSQISSKASAITEKHFDPEENPDYIRPLLNPPSIPVTAFPYPSS